MADKQSTKPPSGTRDFLPDDVRRREYVIDVVRGVYERYGFEPLETPAFENIETLLGKYGEEGNKLIFKILKRGEHEATGEADLALRYDLTVPLARVVAQYQNELPKFFKRYQIQPVWRADRPARGRFREFYQCDIDSIGSTSPVVEVEILSAVSDILTALGFHDFKIRLNHRDVLRGALDRYGVPPALDEEALIAIDKYDKVGGEGVRRELLARGVPESATERLVEALERSQVEVGGVYDLASVNTEVLRLNRERIQGHAAGVAGIDNLSQIVGLCDRTTAGEHVLVSTSLARGLSYYTGAIMEIAVDGIGSLGGGGRYDNLVGMFLGREVPACGFSLGLERIIVLMTERNMFPPGVATGAVDILVTIWNDESRADSLALAADLRKRGLRVDVYPEADKLGKQFKYASSRSAPFVAILGDDERTQGKVAVKDLRSGEQTAMPRDQVAGFVAANREPRP